MAFTIRALACCSLLALAGVSVGHAQERAAAGSTETQMTWSTLSKLVDAANNQSKAANARMDQSIVCNKKSKAYAPGAPGADGDGCIENIFIKRLTERMDAMDKTVEEINKRLTSVEGDVGVIKGSITKLTADVKKLSGRVDVAEDKIASLDVKMKVLETKVSVLEGKLEDESAARKAADKDIKADLADEVAARKAADKDIKADLATEVTARKAADKDLKADITDINNRIDDLESEVYTLSEKMRDMQADVWDNTQAITAVRACGKKAMVWSGTAMSCVNANVKAPAANCSLDLYVSNYGGACKAGYVSLGTFTETPVYTHANEGKSGTYRNCVKVVCE